MSPMMYNPYNTGTAAAGGKGGTVEASVEAPWEEGRHDRWSANGQCSASTAPPTAPPIAPAPAPVAEPDPCRTCGALTRSRLGLLPRLHDGLLPEPDG